MVNLRVVSITVMVATGMIGAVQVAGPESLGISSVAIRWLGIIAAGLAILQGFLPRVQGPTTDPESLIERISALPREDRQMIATGLADRARQATMPRIPDPLPIERRQTRG